MKKCMLWLSLVSLYASEVEKKEDNLNEKKTLLLLCGVGGKIHYDSEKYFSDYNKITLGLECVSCEQHINMSVTEEGVEKRQEIKGLPENVTDIVFEHCPLFFFLSHENLSDNEGATASESDGEVEKSIDFSKLKFNKNFINNINYFKKKYPKANFFILADRIKENSQNEYGQKNLKKWFHNSFKDFKNIEYNYEGKNNLHKINFSSVHLR